MPTIAVASAAPAGAASGIPVLSATWNDDSFRYSEDEAGTPGTPSDGGPRAGIRIDLTVAGGTMDSLTCALSTTGEVRLRDNLAPVIAPVIQGSTAWATSNGSIAADGWATSSPIGSGPSTTFNFTRGSTGPGTYLLRLVVDSITGTDFPFTFTFSSPDAALSSIVVANASQVSPYITGAP